MKWVTITDYMPIIHKLELPRNIICTSLITR